MECYFISSFRVKENDSGQEEGAGKREGAEREICILTESTSKLYDSLFSLFGSYMISFSGLKAHL